jgi:short-subunit dehydrogenase
MKKVLITGASRGIGYETAKFFAKKNHALFLIARDLKKLKKIKDEIREINSELPCQIMSFDLLDLDKIQSLASNIKNKFGFIDIIIHNGGSLIKKNFIDMNKEDLINSFTVNYFSPFLITQKIIPNLTKTAHVVFISSVGGVNGTVKFPGLSSYSPSKGALITLTECLAEEFKMSKLRFNCLALGAVQTDMLKKAFPGYEAPLSPEEMATFIFDFSMKGGDFFNGKVLPISTTTP